MKSYKKRLSDSRIIQLATNGGLDQIYGGITVAQLARVTCLDGYTALHYAARFGHLNEIRGGATLKQLAEVKSEFDWIMEFNVTASRAFQMFSGVTALSVAITYGHLDQIRGRVTLEDFRTASDQIGRPMMHILDELIDKGDDPAALGNNIVACSEILGLLSSENPIHVAAIRNALSRNRGLESLLSADMVAALI